MLNELNPPMIQSELYDIALDLALKYIDKLEAERPGELSDEDFAKFHGCWVKPLQPQESPLVDFSRLEAEMIRITAHDETKRKQMEQAVAALKASGKMLEEQIAKIGKEPRVVQSRSVDLSTGCPTTLKYDPNFFPCSAIEYKKWVDWNSESNPPIQWYEEEVKTQERSLRYAQDFYMEEGASLAKDRLKIIKEAFAREIIKSGRVEAPSQSAATGSPDSEWTKILADD